MQIYGSMMESSQSLVSQLLSYEQRGAAPETSDEAQKAFEGTRREGPGTDHSPAFGFTFTRLPERSPRVIPILRPFLILFAMVSGRPSNERPHLGIPTNTRPTSDPMYWSPYSNDDDQPPAVPPKDPHLNPVFLSPVSTSFPPTAYARPRYTSFSVYEPQSASMAFPEPQPHRVSSRRSILGLKPPIRHRMSKSDFGSGASSESLWRQGSDRGSYAPTVFCPFFVSGTLVTLLRPAGTPSSRRSP